MSAARTAGTGSTGHAHVAREESPAPVAANLHLWAGTLTGVGRDACFAIVDAHLAGPVAGPATAETAGQRP